MSEEWEKLERKLKSLPPEDRLPYLRKWREERTIDWLYRTLRELVSDKYRIEMRDGKEPIIAIVPDSYEKHPWTHFGGTSLENALMRAITRLRNMEHTRQFLR